MLRNWVILAIWGTHKTARIIDSSQVSVGLIHSLRDLINQNPRRICSGDHFFDVLIYPSFVPATCSVHRRPFDLGYGRGVDRCGGRGENQSSCIIIPVTRFNFNRGKVRSHGASFTDKPEADIEQNEEAWRQCRQWRIDVVSYERSRRAFLTLGDVGQIGQDRTGSFADAHR